MQPDYDLLIVGGGMVGASLARAVSGLGLRIGVVETFTVDAESQPSFDDRVIALSWGSRLILEAMGVWPAMVSVFPRPPELLDAGLLGRGII